MNYIVITACIIVMIYMISRFKGSRYVLGEAIKIQEYMKNKKINDKIVLERHKWKDTKQDVNIDWKNPEPKDYEGMKFNPFVMDEIGPFSQLNTEFEPTIDPARAERWKMGPIKTSPDWTEFKEHNPELFQVTLTGTVLNGTLLTERDDRVLHYYLKGNVPPNGEWHVTGILRGQKEIDVTVFQAVTR